MRTLRSYKSTSEDHSDREPEKKRLAPSAPLTTPVQLLLPFPEFLKHEHPNP